MATKTKTENTGKKEFTMVEAFHVWRNESKSGKHFFSGALGESNGGKKIIGFYNSKKQNPKEPDVRIYLVDDEGKREDKEIASMWCNVSEKTGKKYLSGKFGKEKIVGFFNSGKNEKAPYFTAYYSEVEANPDQLKMETPNSRFAPGTPNAPSKPEASDDATEKEPF